MDALGALSELSVGALSRALSRAVAQDYRSGLSIGSLSDPFSQGSRSGLSFKAVALQGG